METDSPAPAVYPRCRTSNKPIYSHGNFFLGSYIGRCIGTPPGMADNIGPHNVWDLTTTCFRGYRARSLGNLAG